MNNPTTTTTTTASNNNNITHVYIILALCIQYIIALYAFYMWNPYNISTRYPSYTIMFLQLNILVNFIIYYYFTKTKLDITSNIGDKIKLEKKDIASYGMILLCSLSVFVSLYYIWKLALNIHSFQTLYIYLIDFLIICGLLGIVYLTIKNTGKSQSLDGVKEYAFTVPTMLISLAEYMKTEFTTVNNPVWILLAIEVALILFRVLLPNIIHYISSHDKSELLGNPIYLNKEHNLGKYENMIVTDKKKFSYNYSVSFWFYINPQPPNTSAAYNKYTNILNYGNKPSVQFHSKKNKLRVRCVEKDDSMTTIYETDALQYQKWNNMVINYDAGNMDVFINGDLVGSRQNIAPFMTFEKIYSGEKKGIEGGICNVNYFGHVQSLSSITNTYNLLKNNDIPYIY